jgi:hypothetical protein
MWAVSASECSASCGRPDFDSAASILPLSLDIALTLDYREIAQQMLSVRRCRVARGSQDEMA